MGSVQQWWYKASGCDTNCCTSPDGLRWVDVGFVLPPECFFSGFDAAELDEVGQIGKAVERLLPARLVLSPAG